MKKVREWLETGAFVIAACAIAYGAIVFAMHGPAGKTVVVEFSDFECPACEWYHTGGAYDEIHKFIDQGTITYAHVDLPLPGHELAKPAARMSQCATGLQYWGVNEFLYAYLQQEKHLPTAIRTAYVAGMPDDVYQRCLETLHETSVEDTAPEIGVHVTPTFIIGTLDAKGDLAATTKVNGVLTPVMLKKLL